MGGISHLRCVIGNVLRIGIITPAPPLSQDGNRVTALRWQRILRGLGHRVTLAQSYEGQPFELLIALHAWRSYASIRRFQSEHPQGPLIVALTGTDLYRDLPRSRRAYESLQLATHVIVLQPKALEELGREFQRKARVIYQSAAVTSPSRPAPAGPVKGETGAIGKAPAYFDVSVVGHLRAVKNPFQPATAARWLPRDSRIRVLHLGRATTPAYAARARFEMMVNRRYLWLGERPRGFVLRLLRRSQLFVHPSRLEGGANALSEAIVAGVPIVASDIPGNVGILGEDYPGYFDVGDKTALTRLLRRAETDPAFLADLKTRCRKLAPLFAPRREKSAWAELMKEVLAAED